MHYRFIDLFAGIGGLRLGFERACLSLGHTSECVLTAEIKPSACKVLDRHFPGHNNVGDVTAVCTDDIPAFDVLLGGFPCQAFSIAGRRAGFEDTRGTLFFDVARILRDKRPSHFILENVDNLVVHNRRSKLDSIGETFQVILGVLEDLGYHVSWRRLNAYDFGVPQKRLRVFICGSLSSAPDLSAFPVIPSCLADILEEGLPPVHNKYLDRLLDGRDPYSLQGSKVTSFHSGTRTIPGWRFGALGDVDGEDKALLDFILTHSRVTKLYPKEISVRPLPTDYLAERVGWEGLEERLERLQDMGYIRLAYPRALGKDYTDMPKGWVLKFGGFSYGIKHICRLDSFVFTLAALDAHLHHVPTTCRETGEVGLRPFTVVELCRLSGFPDDWLAGVRFHTACDLIGNSVVVPCLEAVAVRTLLS